MLVRPPETLLIAAVIIKNKVEFELIFVSKCYASVINKKKQVAMEKRNGNTQFKGVVKLTSQKEMAIITLAVQIGNENV